MCLRVDDILGLEGDAYSLIVRRKTVDVVICNQTFSL